MRVIIDRFEGAYAVVELPSRQTANLPRQVLPAEAREGDVVRIEIDTQETAIRRKNIQELMQDVLDSNK